MTKYIPPVRRVDRGKYHHYEDGDGHRIPGVTTILSAGIPKPALINWAANATAEGAINDWDQLTMLPPAQRLKALQGIRYEATNTAKNKGTIIHAYGEKLVQGQPVKLRKDEEPLRPYIDSYARFLDEWNVQPILIEVVIVNYTWGYAGTLDLVAEVTTPAGDVETRLLDIKTGEKGVYDETALQLAAYRNAEFYVNNDGNERTMIPVDDTAAIHVTADAAVMIPTVSDTYDQNGTTKSVFKQFLYAQKIYELDQVEGLILPAEYQPSRSTAHIVWGDDE